MGRRKEADRTLVALYNQNGKALEDLKAWRNELTHEKHFYSHLELEDWRLFFSENWQFNKLLPQDGTIIEYEEFVKFSAILLNSYLKWFLTESGTQIKAHYGL